MRLESHLMNCHFCGKPLDPDSTQVYREVLLWVSVSNDGKESQVFPKYTDEWACDDCIQYLTSREKRNQLTIFDVIEPDKTSGDSDVIDHAEWQRGFESGWRQDQLLRDLGTQHPDFAAGYEAGQVKRLDSEKEHGRWVGESFLNARGMVDIPGKSDNVNPHVPVKVDPIKPIEPKRGN
jgi:hypothetical protein